MLSLDHREFVQALPRAVRSQLIQKTNGPGLLWLLRHLLGIMILGWLISSDSLFTFEIYLAVKVGLMMILGILIVFLFTLLHETVHGTPFRSSWLNTWVGRICGFVILLPPFWFKLFHYDHHRYTHIPGKDPELDTPSPTSQAGLIFHLSGLPVWRGHLKALFVNAFLDQRDRFVNPEDQRKVRSEARWMWLGYVSLIVISVITENPILLYVWIIPGILGQPFLRVYLMAEHGFCPHSKNMFENTRTVFTSPLVRRLAWNMPYHVEHHVMPGVPFYKLPELHKLTQPYLQHTQQGYGSFLLRLLRQTDSRTGST